MLAEAEMLSIATAANTTAGRVIDCGVKTAGGLSAGLRMAEVCTAGLATVHATAAPMVLDSGPAISIHTDQPVAACMASQYAGWQIAPEGYFAMGSGPMRAAAAREELFDKIDYRERPQSVVGVLETGQLPDDSVIEYIAEKCGVQAAGVALLVAPTASIAGTVQIVARSVETALHKLFDLGFDLRRVRSGWGIAPLPPVAADDLTAIGRTNDAILYGGQVVLWVEADDDELRRVGPQVPSVASSDHGRPFREIFERHNRDFYKIDPKLFSPAEITLVNLASGRSWQFGRLEPDVLRESFDTTAET